MKRTTKKSTTKKPARSSRRKEPSEKPRHDWLSRSPLLTIDGMKPGIHSLRYADPKNPEKRGKPGGQQSEFQLFIAITDTHNAPIEEARYHGVFPRNRFDVQFDSRDDGKIATHYGRWVSNRGEHGPWSAPVSLRIAA